MATKQVGVLLLPRFPLLAFSSFVTPLQEANRLSNRALYDISLLSLDGHPAQAEGGVTVAPVRPLHGLQPFQMAFVCAGIAPKANANPAVLAWVRANALRGAALGAISTGTHVLALAGVMRGERCTIHWENAASFTEDFPDIALTQSIFEIDGKILTCGGGTAAMDMTLNIIGRDHGPELALAVSHQFQHERIRTQLDLQDSAAFFAQQSRSVKMAEAEHFIQTRGAALLRPRDVARQVGISQRQLDRLFRSHLGRTPVQYLTECRARQARELLLTTNLQVTEIAIAAGFGSRSNFHRCYRRLFGRTPKEERDMARRFAAVAVLS